MIEEEIIKSTNPDSLPKHKEQISGANFSSINNRNKRIAEIEEQLSVFHSKGLTAEDIKKIRLAKRKEFKELQDLELSKATSEEIYEKIEREIFLKALIDNEEFDRLNLEKQELINLNLAEEALNRLKLMGATIPHRERAIKIFTTPEIIDIDQYKLAELLGFPLDNKEFMVKLGSDDKLEEIRQKLLNSQLITNEFKNILFNPRISLADPEKVKASNEEVNIKDLNDSELVDLGIEKIKQIVREIINDKDNKVASGKFWNVIISNNSDYVLKIQRIMEDPEEDKYQKESLFNYSIIKKVLGAEYLPRQALLKIPNTKKLYILQEKLDLDKMISLTTNNIEDVLKGKDGQRIRKALQIENNKNKLKEFILNSEKLYNEHKLMIDFIGDNLFLGLDSNGNLIIKLVDYGCFNEESAENNSTSKSKDFLKKLNELIK